MNLGQVIFSTFKAGKGRLICLVYRKGLQMPVRLYTAVGLILIALARPRRCRPTGCFGLVDSIVRDVKRRQCWPDPFLTADRAAVTCALA